MSVSAADAYSLDDEIHRTMFDPSTEDPCVAVVEAIEAATEPSEATAVLADSIDPDTLTRLYRDGGGESWMLNFEHDGLEITLWGDGRIHVDTGIESATTTTQTTGSNSDW